MQVLLMISLGIPKVLNGLNVSDNRVIGIKRFLQPVSNLFGDLQLFIRVSEDSRSVLSSGVSPLLIFSSRIMNSEEEINQCLVAHDFRIKRKLQSLGI